MIVQTLIKIGNSAGILLPQVLRQEFNLRIGDKIEVSKDKKKGKIIISPYKNRLVKGVNTKFAKMVDEFINEHEDVLAELSKR